MDAQFLFVALGAGRWLIGPEASPDVLRTRNDAEGVVLLHWLVLRPRERLPAALFTDGGNSAVSMLLRRGLAAVASVCPDLAAELEGCVRARKGFVWYERDSMSPTIRTEGTGCVNVRRAPRNWVKLVKLN